MKTLLIEKYIKVAVKKALKEQEDQLKRQEKSIYLIYRFPGLKKVMTDMMSPAFSHYISNVSLVSPKPTTFNIFLTNGMNFYMSYSGRGNFIANIAGKKYNLVNLGETERASSSITNMLKLNYQPVDEYEKEKATARDNELKADLQGNTGGGSSSFPSNDIPPPTGRDETPPPTDGEPEFNPEEFDLPPDENEEEPEEEI